MIGYLRGNLISKTETVAIVDVSGVGYVVSIPQTTLQDSILNEEIQLHVVTVVREDDISLYGFQDQEHKRAFETLCKVNKVGPKLAITILGTLDLASLVSAVENSQVAVLSKISGIGKKTAERLCLELKGKITPPLGSISSGSSGIIAKPRPKQDPLQLALAQLDYRKSEIDLVLGSGEIPPMEDASLQERLRAALRYLAKQT